MVQEHLCDRFQGGLRMKIGVHLGGKQDRGAHIHHIEYLDDMLLLARGISRDGGSIFEIDLPRTQGCRTRDRLMGRVQWLCNAPISAQYLPDRAGRLRQWDGMPLQSRITS